MASVLGSAVIVARSRRCCDRAQQKIFYEQGQSTIRIAHVCPVAQCAMIGSHAQCRQKRWRIESLWSLPNPRFKCCNHSIRAVLIPLLSQFVVVRAGAGVWSVSGKHLCLESLLCASSTATFAPTPFCAEQRHKHHKQQTRESGQSGGNQRVVRGRFG
jgi:hypothetical protein